MVCITRSEAGQTAQTDGLGGCSECGFDIKLVRMNLGFRKNTSLFPMTALSKEPLT